MSFFSSMVKTRSKEDNVFYHELKKLLSFKPLKLNVYKKAFTHRSLKITDEFGKPVNYERLEFLGDAILGSIIACYLYDKVPKGNEGYLTQMRSKVVSRKHLNRLGKKLHLIRFVRSSVPENQIGDDIHGNILEALIGAIYLDRGYEYCRRFVYKKLITPYIDLDQLENKITSYKGLLIEWCQKEKKQYQFNTYEDTGKATQKHFSVRINIDGKTIAKGRSTSKKKAEEIAAKRVYFALQNQITNS